MTDTAYVVVEKRREYPTETIRRIFDNRSSAESYIEDEDRHDVMSIEPFGIDTSWPTAETDDKIEDGIANDRIALFTEHVYDPDADEMKRESLTVIGGETQYPDEVRDAITHQFGFNPNALTTEKTPYMAATDLMTSRLPIGFAMRTLADEWQRVTGNRPPGGHERAVPEDLLDEIADTLETEAKTSLDDKEELWDLAEKVRDQMNES